MTTNRDWAHLSDDQLVNAFQRIAHNVARQGEHNQAALDILREMADELTARHNAVKA